MAMVSATTLCGYVYPSCSKIIEQQLATAILLNIAGCGQWSGSVCRGVGSSFVYVPWLEGRWKGVEGVGF
jgi:hypothetical protein